jgi:hypothetical protein
MLQTIWTLAELTPEQERALEEAEAMLGGGVLLAFKGHEATPSQLTPSQLDCLRGLEQRLGLVLVAVHPG